uniref:CS domain-containing protein n=1 Tax=Megaselia scalaris TaxID=36166 RepID=T1GS80_MEGSC
MSSEKIVPPPVKWAQRTDLLYVDIAAECKDIDFKFTEDSMNFKGVDSSSNQKYEVTLNFYNKINPDNILTKNNSR